jgi:hypothetical protein
MFQGRRLGKTVVNSVAKTIKNTLAIPAYAYGDNQAACEAFDALRKAATEIERLSREVERMKAGITAIYHHNEACRVGVLEHFRPWWLLERHS